MSDIKTQIKTNTFTTTTICWEVFIFTDEQTRANCITEVICRRWSSRRRRPVTFSFVFECNVLPKKNERNTHTTAPVRFGIIVTLRQTTEFDSRALTISEIEAVFKNLNCLKQVCKIWSVVKLRHLLVDSSNNTTVIAETYYSSIKYENLCHKGWNYWATSL